MGIVNSLRSSPRHLAVLIVSLWLLAATLYCHFHGYIALNGTPDLAFSLKWALSNWGVWLVLAPLLVGAWHQRQPLVEFAILTGLGALVLATAVVVLIDQISGLAIPLTNNLYWTVPRAAALLALVVAGEMGRRMIVQGEMPVVREPGRIEVDTGDATALVLDEEIRWVGANGNYVEISDGRNRGRLRCTLNQFAADIPNDRFHRIHRSFLINIDFIDRIEPVPGSRVSRVYLVGDSRAVPASRQGLKSLRDRLAS